MEAEDQRAKAGRPRLYDDPEAFAQKANDYFEQLEAGKPPTLAGLCRFMGFYDRESFSTYATYGEQFSRTVKTVDLRILEDRQERLMMKFTPGVIFDLKNNHGWRDKTETELSGGISLTHEEALKALD
jgi:hypothetical protein